MEAGVASVVEEDGVLAISREVNGFTLSELRFPPGYVQDAFDPELSVPRVRARRAVSRNVSAPNDAARRCLRGDDARRRLARRPVRRRRSPDRDRPAQGRGGRSPSRLDRLAELRGRGLSWLAWRLAGELRASDAAAPLAAEGFALELLAATSRETRPERNGGRLAAWLRAAEEMLRARSLHVGLSELAEAVGVHPTHLARVFRARYGVSVGEYGRRAPVWRGRQPSSPAATRRSPRSRLRAGFADQSHFTRVFKRHVGITPARYRAETHAMLGTFQTP